MGFDISPTPEYLKPLMVSWFKHLQHVDIPFSPWQYTGYVADRSTEQFIQDIETVAKACDIDIDRHKIRTQTYLNDLHSLYEQHYDGQQHWTDFHEYVHILEGKIRHQPQQERLEINYWELGGLLKKPFDRQWLQHARHHLDPGDVYLAWDELGKKAYKYWVDQEPNDIDRLCELVRPWIEIRPKIHIALSAADLRPDPDPDFQSWWSCYESEWQRYNSVPDWSLEDWDSVLVIGQMEQWQQLRDQLDQKNWPRRMWL